MEYSIRWHEDAVSDLKKIDKNHRKKIIEKVKTHLVKDPISLGKPLRGMFKGMYRYLFGDYRILYIIREQELEILITTVGHRKNVYQQK